MKQIRLHILTILLITIFFGFFVVVIYADYQPEPLVAPKSNIPELTGTDGRRYKIVVIDNCEYLITEYSSGHEGYGYMSHKGNCRFCDERNKH